MEHMLFGVSDGLDEAENRVKAANVFIPHLCAKSNGEGWSVALTMIECQGRGIVPASTPKSSSPFIDGES